MSEKIRSVKSIISSIKRILKKEGEYSPSFDMAISDLAEVTHLKEIAFIDATVGFGNIDSEGSKEGFEDRGGRSVVFENSREGDRRYKINPAFTIYLELARESQRMLSELCMTAKSSKSVQDDLLDEMDRKREEAGRG